MAASSTGLAAAELPAMNATRWVNPARSLSRSCAAGGIDRCLGAHLHQLDAHVSIRKGLESRLFALGLVVVGVHDPEFAFGKLPRTSIAAYAITD
jgi:hypothetical protein